jgi:hypothetical protein
MVQDTVPIVVGRKSLGEEPSQRTQLTTPQLDCDELTHLDLDPDEPVTEVDLRRGRVRR